MRASRENPLDIGGSAGASDQIHIARQGPPPHARRVILQAKIESLRVQRDHMMNGQIGEQGRRRRGRMEHQRAGFRHAAQRQPDRQHRIGPQFFIGLQTAPVELLQTWVGLQGEVRRQDIVVDITADRRRQIVPRQRRVRPSRRLFPRPRGRRKARASRCRGAAAGFSASQRRRRPIRRKCRAGRRRRDASRAAIGGWCFSLSFAVSPARILRHEAAGGRLWQVAPSRPSRGQRHSAKSTRPGRKDASAARRRPAPDGKVAAARRRRPRQPPTLGWRPARSRRASFFPASRATGSAAEYRPGRPRGIGR